MIREELLILSRFTIVSDFLRNSKAFMGLCLSGRVCSNPIVVLIKLALEKVGFVSNMNTNFHHEFELCLLNKLLFCPQYTPELFVNLVAFESSLLVSPLVARVSFYSVVQRPHDNTKVRLSLVFEGVLAYLVADLIRKDELKTSF